MGMFCRSLFVLLSFFCWSLCCLLFFFLLPSVSSNFLLWFLRFPRYEGPKVTHAEYLECLFYVRFFPWDCIWNFLPVFFKKVWSNSYGLKRDPKGPTPKMITFYFKSDLYANFSIEILWKIPVWNMARRVWRYQRGNQNPLIEEGQTAQWPK